MSTSSNQSRDFVGQITAYFINSPVTILFAVALAVFSVIALVLTPKEENPQIVIPSAQITFTYPGAPAAVVERSLTTIMESKLRELEGIDHIYSVSQDSGSMIAVQFKVGTDWEKGIFTLQDQLFANRNFMPPGVSYEVHPSRTDDVPIVTLTLHSRLRSDNQLRRVAERLLEDLRQIPDTANLTISGGQPRMIAVDIDPDRLASRKLSPLTIAQALRNANTRLPGGDLANGQFRISVQGGNLFQTAQDVGRVLVGFGEDSSPIYLSDVATITDRYRSRTSYSRIHYRSDSDLTAPDPEINARPKGEFHSEPAVSIGIAKRKGTNAVAVAEAVFHRLGELKAQLPADIKIAVTRNDGYNAESTVENLFHELIVATLVVVVMMIMFLGWRDSLIVAVVIPLTLGTTIGIAWLTGHTINKVAMFALIISLGILVDDGVVIVENIHRRFELKPDLSWNEKLQEAVAAVSEIGSPTVLATFTVVLSFYPLNYITGLVGPYLAPLGFNVPVAMVLSLLLAITVTPYMAVRLIKIKPGQGHDADVTSSRIYRFYAGVMQPLLDSKFWRRVVLLTVTGLLLATLTLPLFQAVRVRVLPKGNDSTFLVQLDAPVGTDLDRTDRIVRDLEAVLRTHAEIINFETYAGTNAPIDFNALIKGGANRTEKHYADIRVHITDKAARGITTENLVIGLRPRLARVAAKYNAVVRILENPPGPPQRSTVLAEIYGPDRQMLRTLAKQVRQVFTHTTEVVDIDDSGKNQMPQVRLGVDQDKAMRSGIATSDIAQTLNMLVSGSDVSTFEVPGEILPVGIQVRFAPQFRQRIEDLNRIQLPAASGALLPLSELVLQGTEAADQPIFHKDNRPVAYVYGEMGDRSSLYAVFDQLAYFTSHPLPEGYHIEWDGEWRLTLDLFRDVGLALSAAMLMIYLLLVGQFKSFQVPIIILGSIPLALIGILIAFALNHAYFSALSLIGVIALAGMVVRNAIVLLEFIGKRLAEGENLKHAVLEAGAVRFRPILLTSLAAILGNAPILLDPIWAGLGWTIITGMMASSALTLVVIPLLYYGQQLKQQPQPPARPAEPPVEPPALNALET
ncbi:efflux RND transporter permease subunit [Gloeobacter morelensis]|uniref:Efflux RND transporter permease subunit n=1 Tax=Gloeobacter morelensis MG652769 TaxID=2781736 RepID=A0ABY3PSQ8_9CYAN|nr:efflux RND transporter permease subunit [Gloeobacter morelensis]UFP96735.1 efflux RND transporter permease subunit [Gloeobacter morelensis MG652769]